MISHSLIDLEKYYTLHLLNGDADKCEYDSLYVQLDMGPGQAELFLDL